MADDFDDYDYDPEAIAALIDLLDVEDITPAMGPRPPRGRAQRGTVAIEIDDCRGEFEGSDKPTPDPFDLRIRRGA